MGHTVASVAGRALVLEKETGLQDERIHTLETSITTILQSMARVETNMKAVVRSANGQKANGKKPRRMEILTGVVLALTGLNFLGLIEPIGLAFRTWITGGG